MKRPVSLFLAVLFAAFTLNLSTVSAAERTIDWGHVSKNLVKALASDNDGLRQSAMILIVRHADKLRVNDAVYDVMHTYRHHKDEKVRKLALATLHQMQSKWAMGFLRMDLKFQENERLRRMVIAILRDYEARRTETL